MRKGYEPCLAFDHNDRLVAIATGSDACAEHECGSKPLREALCGPRASGTKNFYRTFVPNRDNHSLLEASASAVIGRISEASLTSRAPYPG